MLHAREDTSIKRTELSAPCIAAVAAKHVQRFQRVSLFTIEEVCGGWQKAQQTHFGDGGVFDRIYQPGR